MPITRFTSPRAQDARILKSGLKWRMRSRAGSQARSRQVNKMSWISPPRRSRPTAASDRRSSGLERCLLQPLRKRPERLDVGGAEIHLLVADHHDDRLRLHDAHENRSLRAHAVGDGEIPALAVRLEGKMLDQSEIVGPAV